MAVDLPKQSLSCLWFPGAGWKSEPESWNCGGFSWPHSFPKHRPDKASKCLLGFLPATDGGCQPPSQRETCLERGHNEVSGRHGLEYTDPLHSYWLWVCFGERPPHTHNRAGALQRFPSVNKADQLPGWGRLQDQLLAHLDFSQVCCNKVPQTAEVCHFVVIDAGKLRFCAL